MTPDRYEDTASFVLGELEWNRAQPENRNGPLRTPAVRKISTQTYALVKKLDKDALFSSCEQLLETQDIDARLIAFEWAFRRRTELQFFDFPRFERWLYAYVDGWGSCDDFCTHAFGALVYQFPECFPEVRVWTQSDNQWVRRAAAVVLIYAVRRESMFEESFAVADLLMADEEDLVRKGYGWLLKEISKKNPQIVFDYVMRHKSTMPRVSLRYAIEKLDPNLKKQAMAKP